MLFHNKKFDFFRFFLGDKSEKELYEWIKHCESVYIQTVLFSGTIRSAVRIAKVLAFVDEAKFVVRPLNVFNAGRSGQSVNIHAKPIFSVGLEDLGTRDPSV